MDKKLIKEDIANMKYLFGYKPGRVISEQDIDYTTDDYLDTNDTELDESNPFKIGEDFEEYEDEFEFDGDMNEQYDDQNGMNWVQNTTMDRQSPIDDDNDVEGGVISILKKHHLLDNVEEPDDSRILVRNQSSEVVQKILSLLPSFTELGFLALINCESADFSDIDICGLPNLAFVNLNGTENNFEEQGYECVNTDDSPFYFLE